MTDKEEIIIDGVDVSNCPKYATNEEFNLEKAKGKDLCLNCAGVKCFYKKYELLKIQNQQQYMDFKNKEINYEEQIKSLSKDLINLKNNEDLLISELQLLWGKQIAEEQGDCKNIDYLKPRTREIYHRITEIERTLKDVAFSQSVKIGKTKPLGDIGSPKSYKRWEARERKLLEREFLK